MEHSYYQKEYWRCEMGLAIIFLPCNRLSSSLLRFVPYVLFSGQMDDPSMVSIKNIFNNINLPLFFDSRITPVPKIGLWTFLPT